MNRIKYAIMLAMDEISTPCKSNGKCPSILIDCDAQSTFQSMLSDYKIEPCIG